MLIPCSGSQDWHELAEHSALIYYYNICKKLNLKTKFYADDHIYYDSYKIGYIRSKGVDNIRTNLKKTHLYKSESITDLIHVFKLNTIYTAKQLIEFEKQEVARRICNITPLQPTNLDPELHQLLVECASRLHRLCNSHLDRLSCNSNGIRIIRLADSVLIKYHQITYYKPNQTKLILEYLNQMQADLSNLLIEIQTLGELKLWDLEICASVAEPIIKSRGIVKRHIKNLSKINPGTINPKTFNS